MTGPSSMQCQTKRCYVAAHSLYNRSLQSHLSEILQSTVNLWIPLWLLPQPVLKDSDNHHNNFQHLWQVCGTGLFLSSFILHHLSIVSKAAYPVGFLHKLTKCCCAGGLRVPWALTTRHWSLCRCFSSLHPLSQLGKSIAKAMTALTVYQLTTQDKSCPAAKPLQQTPKLMYRLMGMQACKVCKGLTITTQLLKQG